MSHLKRERVSVSRRSRRPVARGGAKDALEETAALGFIAAGNRAVAGLLSGRMVQRKIEWSDAVKAGEAWNAGEKLVGNIRRIPLEGLGEGMQTDKAKRWKKDPADPKKGTFVDEPTEIAALSPEKAKGKAIVLVPAKLDATQKIEVVVFLHGWTEGTHRPYAGWRALVMAPPKPSTKKKTRRKRRRRSSSGACVRDETTRTWRRFGTSLSTRWPSSWRRAPTPRR